MNTPAPTPYDIKSIPRFPFEPSSTLWFILFALALVALLITIVWWYSSRSKSSPVDLKDAAEELFKYDSVGGQRFVLKRLSSLIRSFLSTQLELPLSARAQTEIAHLREHELMRSELVPLVDELLWIEESRFSGAAVSAERMRQSIETFISILETSKQTEQAKNVG